MIVETVILTPEDAQKMLALSEGQVQRGLRKNAVDRLVHAIKAEQWQVTHQAIALDANGVVLDGQHRLHAIARAGRAVEVQIARDVPRRTFEVIDTGSSRSPADILRIAGYSNTTQLAAATRMLLTYDEVVGTTDTFNAIRTRFTAADILREVESDRGLVMVQAISPAMGVAQQLGHGGFATWLATLIVLLRTNEDVGQSIALDFVQALRDGAALPQGSPILTLRRYLSSDGGLIRAGQGERPQIGLATSIKAFNRWAAGDTSQLLAFRIGIERMPALAPV